MTLMTAIGSSIESRFKIHPEVVAGGNTVQKETKAVVKHNVLSNCA
jgi:hypothetical protein